MERLTVIERPDERFTEAEQECRARAFDLAVDNLPLMFVYATKDSYSVAWDGVLDFSQLDVEALDRLPSKLASFQWSDGRNIVREAARVSFLVGSDVIELKLRVPENHLRYQELLEGMEFSLVRYDIDSDSLRYSFTAERPLVERQIGELAVMRPSAEPITPKFLRWVLDRHIAGDQIRAGVSEKHILVTLNSLVQV